MPKLLDAVAGNTTGTAHTFNNPVAVYASGTFNGGTVTILSAAPGGTFVSIKTMTAPENFVVDPPGVFQLRADFTGSGASVTVEAVSDRAPRQLQ
jgi:hypothetical protein